MPVIASIVEQHVEEAAFLSASRDRAVHAPHLGLVGLARLDERLEASLDGLRVAGEAGLTAALTALATGDASEVFVAAVMAVEHGDAQRLQGVLELGATSMERSRGLVAALGWLPWDRAEPVVRELLDSDGPLVRRVGLAGCAVHRRDPGDALVDALRDGDPKLLSRACRAAGELGRWDLLPLLRAPLGSDDEDVRFWAAWAAALLGEASVARLLGAVTAAGGRHAEEACLLGIRLFDEDRAMRAHEELANVPELSRLAVKAAGASGYPAAVPRLLECMDEPALARAAAEAFTALTGVDLEAQGLQADRPEDFDSGPTEDPGDEDVAPDPDDNLSWPYVEGLRQWWRDHRGGFNSGERYFLGNPVSEPWLQEVLRTGTQRQRAAAALELRLLQPGQPLFETRAPALRQWILLGG